MSKRFSSNSNIICFVKKIFWSRDRAGPAWGYLMYTPVMESPFRFVRLRLRTPDSVCEFLSSWSGPLIDFHTMQFKHNMAIIRPTNHYDLLNLIIRLLFVVVLVPEPELVRYDRADNAAAVADSKGILNVLKLLSQPA